MIGSVTRFTASCAALLCAVLISACASVPKEAVELSYQIGEDLGALHHSCDAMVVSRFAEFRARRVAYLENEWIPLFLKDWVTEGKLVETARGEVVWSDEADDFVAPMAGREEQQMLATVREWSEAAIDLIEEKRASLIDPLNHQEAEIRSDLLDAFDRMLRGNAHITAHLNSIRKVHDVQSEALDKLGLEEVVQKLDDAIVKVSEQAESGLQEIRKADFKLDDVVDKGKEFIERVRGDD